jgi:hypothetical protein
MPTVERRIEVFENTVLAPWHSETDGWFILYGRV